MKCLKNKLNLRILLIEFLTVKTAASNNFSTNTVGLRSNLIQYFRTHKRPHANISQLIQS